MKSFLESASLAVKAGEVLCLSGPSGAGKTTLMEIMAGVTRPDAGIVKRTAKAALMFQDDVLIPWLSAEGAITYILPPPMPENGGLGMRGLPPERIAAKHLTYTPMGY